MCSNSSRTNASKIPIAVSEKTKFDQSLTRRALKAKNVITVRSHDTALRQIGKAKERENIIKNRLDINRAHFKRLFNASAKDLLLPGKIEVLECYDDIQDDQRSKVFVPKKCTDVHLPV